MTKTMKLFVAGALLATLGFPLAAHARPADPAMIAARTKIFGSANVDQRTGAVNDDRVIFSWLTNATFAAAARGHVMLLDTFVTRLEVMPGRTPFVIQDLVDLHAEAIFLGHGHFDHADNAAYLAQQTNAPIYSTPETCDNMQLDAARNFAAGYTKTSTVTCIGLTSRGSIPGSEIVKVSQFEPDVAISVFKHLHSTNTAPQDTTFPPVIINLPVNGACAPPCNLADPRDASLFPAGTPLSTVMNISTARVGAGGPLALFYSFRVRGEHDFKFVWHNSTGALKEGCALPNNKPGTTTPNEPGQDSKGCFGPAVGAALARIMDDLSPVDVQLGSPVSLGFGINGERDIVTYNLHLRPKVFIPNHVTAVAVESSSLEWRDGYFKELNAMGVPDEARPEVLWLVDPIDYLRPLVFTPGEARRDR